MYQHLFEQYNCAVLVPTYNNCKTVLDVIKELQKYTSSIIVVNDGSTDNTLELLQSINGIEIVSYNENKGKGHALKTGLKKAILLGYKRVISIDSDGQHYPSDLISFFDALKLNPDALIIGARNMNQSHIPQKSSFGNKFSNFWFKFETGISLPDTQSGYRLYPIDKMKDIHFFTNKFEFEIEVIVRSAWADIPVVSTPVSVYYPDPSERVTHFRPLKDFTRISILNTVLVTWMLLYIKPRNLFRLLKKKAPNNFSLIISGR